MEFKMPLTYEQREELQHLMEVAADESHTSNGDNVARVQWMIIEIAYRRLLEGHRLTSFQRWTLHGEISHAADVSPCLTPIAENLDAWNAK